MAQPLHPLIRLLINGLLAAIALAWVLFTVRDAFSAETMTMSQVTRGSLLIRTSEHGQYVAAPMVAADVKMDVTDTIVRTVVTQRFINPSQKWIEATYVFPLPDTAAVDQLRVQVGDRFIEGQIKERQEARKIYEQAKRDGKRAALMEQERPNMFTNSVANIGPGETVIVQIEYQQDVRIDAGEYRLRFPLVVGPRYIPAPTVDADHRVHDPVPDRDRITPPVTHPDSEHINPVTLTVDLKAGFDIGRIETPHHDTKLDRKSKRHLVLSLKDGSVPADRDFEISWQPVASPLPALSLFTEERDGETYTYLSLTPPDANASGRKPLPRDFILVIDRSGSMGGTSIEQARAAAERALSRLKPGDRFNIITFDSVTEYLWTGLQDVTASNLQMARAFIGQIDARGGTEMLDALTTALTQIHNADRRDEDSRLKQVVFLTDGSIGNESELFAAASAMLKDARLFTVGIGSAPNSHLMTGMAERGRGTFTHIGDPSQVTRRMDELFAKLEHPALTNIRISWPSGTKLDVSPGDIPDLYLGEPIVLVAKGGLPRGTVKFSGRLGDRGWSHNLKLRKADSGKGIAALWARRAIKELEASRYQGATHDGIKAGIIKLGLAYHLVTAHTSLVAVDVTPVRPEGETTEHRDVPLMLPAGWEWNGVFGDQPAAPAPMAMAGFANVDALVVSAGEPKQKMTLPQGATPAGLMLLLGLLCLMLALTLFVLRRRNPFAPLTRE